MTADIIKIIIAATELLPGRVIDSAAMSDRRQDRLAMHANGRHRVVDHYNSATAHLAIMRRCWTGPSPIPSRVGSSRETPLPRNATVLGGLKRDFHFVE